MNNTITLTLTDKQMKDLHSGQSITIEPPKVFTARWEPKGGDYTIYGDFKVERCGMNTESFRLAGMEYQTQFQAEQASKALRSYARQLAWVSEHYPDYNISEKSYETDLILATLPNNIAYHLINEIQKGIVSL